MADYAGVKASALQGPFPATDTVPATALWAEKPCVVYAIRRLW
jgi:hypothetical protein